VKKVVACIAAALYLAACGAPTSTSGSGGTSVTTVAGSNAVELAGVASRSRATTEVSSHTLTLVDHPANRLPVTPVSRPVAPLPVADPDRGTADFSCQGFGAPGKIKVMCAPQ
jgi:hypothetical protein